MTKKSRTIGLVRVRAQIIKGKETGKWFVDVPASLTSNGKRKRKLFDNRTEATNVARELRKRVDPVTGLVTVKENVQSISFTEAVKRWAEDEVLRVQTLKKRARTQYIDEYRLRASCRYFGDRLVATISETDLVKYQAFRLESGIKPITINGEFRIVHQVFAWAKKNNFLKQVQKAKPIPVRPTGHIVPTQLEVARIIENLPKKYQTFIWFLAATGCRMSETRNLTWDCVDEINGYIEIKSREGYTPKTHCSERRIPLGKSLLVEFRKQPKTSRYVFPGSVPDKPIGTFKKSWANAVESANIIRGGNRVHVTIKSLRKAHSTWQSDRGVPETVLQDLLGHARGSKVTKQFYIQVTEEAKQAAVIDLPVGQAK